MRNIKITAGEIYHVFNRGMHKQDIFKSDRDRWRFLFLITHLQSDVTLNNISYNSNNFAKQIIKHSVFHKNKTVDKILEDRSIELIAFTLMPNHFHLLIKALNDNAVASYMQRIQNSYTKYVNAKNQTSGHLLQGPYKIVHVDDNDQLLHASAYVHRNCLELVAWKNKAKSYPWSSLQDYLKTNRFESLLVTTPILEQFSRIKEYEEFIDSSSAKDFEGNYQTPSV